FHLPKMPSWNNPARDNIIRFFRLSSDGVHSQTAWLYPNNPYCRKLSDISYKIPSSYKDRQAISDRDIWLCARNCQLRYAADLSADQRASLSHDDISLLRSCRKDQTAPSPHRYRQVHTSLFRIP